MRIRVSKLVYLPIGGALGAGLLVSAFVLPKPQLAASQDCYGSCRSATALTLSRSTVTYGRQSLVEFRVRVTADDPANGKPTGSVDVDAGSRVLCRFDLSDAAGRCSLADRELAPGSYEIEAHYSGDADLDPSTSGREHLVVLKVASRAALSLSRSTVTDGKEADEEFRVRVTTDATGKPTGSVNVDAGSRVLCRFDLSDGDGRCSLGDRELAPGSYEIEAHYSGDADLDPSTSGREHLTVRRA
jgi:Bacterial Ig-like domain (group 3)